jgi:hypothetical protein
MQGSGEASLDFTLPVRTRAVVLRADPQAREAVAHAWIEPVQVVPPAERPPGVALIATRYGGVEVFGLDEQAYIEPAGVWVRPGSATTLVLQSADGRPVAYRIGVSPGPIANVCGLEAGGWREDLRLQPHEWREVIVPPEPGRRSTRLQARAERWFRPSDVDPTSGDERRLGCRLVLR